MVPVYQKKVAIVTGGAQGIGLAICRELGRCNIKIALVDKDEKKAKEAVKTLMFEGLDCKFFHADLSIVNSVSCIPSEVASHFGNIDIIVNNAAPKRDRKFIGMPSIDDWHAHEKLMLSAPFLLCENSKEYLSRSAGCIINISSTVANAVAYEQCSLSNINGDECNDEILAVSYGDLRSG